MTHCNIDFEISRGIELVLAVKKEWQKHYFIYFSRFLRPTFFAMTPPSMHLFHQTLSCESHSRWANFFNFRPIQVLSGLLTISLIIGATRMILDSLASSHSPDEFGANELRFDS
jgi:hypothetical protein